MVDHTAPYLQRMMQFAKERFDPASHLLMILTFVAAHYVFVRNAGGGASISPTVGITLFFLSLVFFFKLRLYDEIKDYEVDVAVNPTRPLARGLVKHGDLYRAIVFCILSELALAAMLSSDTALCMGITMAYSLLMFKEFFIGKYLRPHLTTYAVSHTIVCAFLSVTLCVGLGGYSFQNIPRFVISFAAGSWGIFNIFEFGRKTFTTAEERPNVESYSLIFGRFGAVLLVLAMAIGAAYCFVKTPQLASAQLFVTLQQLLLVVLAAVGILYALLNRHPFGRIYRGASSVYIILVYIAIILSSY